MKKKIVYIDMDNTLCDFRTAYLKALVNNPTQKYPQSEYLFFLNLKPIPNAIEAYNWLKERFIVKILTRPSVRNPLCYTEKRAWVEKYLGLDECENLILCCDKTLLKGDYLIDDCDQEGLFEPEWEHVKFGTEEFKN